MKSRGHLCVKMTMYVFSINVFLCIKIVLVIIKVGKSSNGHL